MTTQPANSPRRPLPAGLVAAGWALLIDIAVIGFALFIRVMILHGPIVQ